MPPALMFNGVIDISHHNATVDLNKAKGDGIAGVIHKATQGQAYVDPTYQADHFLNTVQPAVDTLLVLDLEANPQGPNMTLVEARAFVTHVFEVTGRWPGLYSGHYIKALLGTQTDCVLANCWFWLAQYGPTPVVPTNWSRWTMWQYTDGGMGPEPHKVAGIGRCDRDRFNGTKAQLRAFWKGE